MISFSCEDNDTVALNAIAAALTIIARERLEGNIASPQTSVTVTETTSLGDAVHKTGAVTTGSGAVETVDPEDIDGVTSAHKPTMEEGAAVVAAQTGPNGVRWDARIHSRTKSLDSQGNFKIMRQPKSYATKELWQTFVSEVETQLKGATMASPTGTTVPQGEPDPSKVGFGEMPGGGQFDQPKDGADTPPPPNLEKADTPPPPALENADDTPPPPALENADDTVITFQQVMKTLTSNKAKITAKDLLKICNDYGVDKVVNLKEQTPDIVAAIHDDMLVIINGS